MTVHAPVAGAGACGYERVVRAIASHLPADDALRAEVAETALVSGRDAGTLARASELGSLAGLMLQLAAHRQTGGRRGLIWGQGVAAGLVYALLVELLQLTLLSGAALVVALPALALLLARRDRRLAVAVLTFWSWRLALADASGAVHAVASWSTGADDGVLILRWCLMASGVALAWHVTRRATAV